MISPPTAPRTVEMIPPPARYPTDRRGVTVRFVRACGLTEAASFAANCRSIRLLLNSRKGGCYPLKAVSIIRRPG
jgi:hypothetical protein